MKRFKMTILPVLLLLVGIGATQLAVAQKTAPEIKIKKVDSKLICMVNNKYMGVEQIPIKVEGKTYYGCCQNCVSTLNNNLSARYGVDPVTKKKVDKATAYIVTFDGSNNVLYFQSEKTYQTYLKNIS